MIAKKIKQSKLRLDNFLFFIALLLMILGGFGFIRGFFIAMNTSIPNKTFEKLPIGDLEDIGVDDFGKIYLAEPFYSRVQVYNNHGHFLYGLKIPASGGVFNIYVIGNQNLLVQTNNKRYTFNKNGYLIDQVEYNTGGILQEDLSQFFCYLDYHHF